jgi:hypothetical protein
VVGALHTAPESFDMTTSSTTSTTTDMTAPSTAAPDTDELVALLVAEATREGANPVELRFGDWVGVCADESWVCAMGYDRGPWTADGHPRDLGTPLAVPTVAANAARVVVVTRSVIHHTPPIHNGAPQPPAVHSNRAVVAFIPRCHTDR